MIKIQEINENKEMTYKHKFSAALKHIQELKILVPNIDEYQRNDIDACLTDLYEILSNFYSGDEFPINAICELLNKLAGSSSKYLCINGCQLLVLRIILLLENVFKSLNLRAE